MKEFSKSVNSWWSYRKKFDTTFFSRCSVHYVTLCVFARLQTSRKLWRHRSDKTTSRWSPTHTRLTNGNSQSLKPRSSYCCKLCCQCVMYILLFTKEVMLMGAHRHGQEGALLPPPTSGNVVKCFCALAVTAKRSVDDLFTHYIHNLSSATHRFAPKPPPGLHPWTPWGLLSPDC